MLYRYNNIVRIHLKFASTAIDKVLKANWNKLDKIQYQKIRQALDFM